MSRRTVLPALAVLAVALGVAEGLWAARLANARPCPDELMGCGGGCSDRVGQNNCALAMAVGTGAGTYKVQLSKTETTCWTWTAPADGNFSFAFAGFGAGDNFCIYTDCPTNTQVAWGTSNPTLTWSFSKGQKVWLCCSLDANEPCGTVTVAAK